MWVGLALGYLLCHGLAIVLFPDHAQILSFVFLVAAPLLAGIACILRCRVNRAADGWMALGLGMLLWAGGMSVSMYQVVSLADADAMPGVGMLLYVLYGVPLTFALASPENEAAHVRLIDGVLAVVLGYLFFVHTFAFATVNGATADGMVNLRLMFDIENIFIALFALARHLASASPARHEFFRDLMVFAFVYMISAAYINHFEESSDYGSLVDLVIEVPFLMLVVMASSRRKQAAAAMSPPRRLAHIVRAGSPLMMPATMLVVSALIVRNHPNLAAAGFIVATLGYGLRSVLTQVYSFERQEQLGRLSSLDSLTGLANRRQFDEALQREWRRARRAGTSIGLLMIDIDHFKRLNDTFGHPTGDQCLRAVAQALATAATRASDLVTRYGGEEFAVVLPSTTFAESCRMAEIMRVAIERLHLAAPGPAEVVTVSIGVAFQVPIATDDPSALIAVADAALYEAKRAGRNRVACGA